MMPGRKSLARRFHLVRDKRYIGVELALNDTNITKTTISKVSTPT